MTVEEQIEQAVLAERARCAAIAENCGFALPIDVWMNMTKKEHGAYACRMVAKAIRGESLEYVPPSEE